LSVAVDAGSEAVVRILLDAGADPNFRDDTGATPIMGAFHTRNESLVNLLLPVTEHLATVDVSGDSPIRYARAWKNPKVLEAVRARLADEYAKKPVRTLTVKALPNSLGPHSRFARPRLSAYLQWSIVAARTDLSRTIEAAGLTGRLEADCAARRVLGERACYGLRLAGSSWSLLILEPAVRHLQHEQEARRALITKMSKRLGGVDVMLCEGMLFSLWRHGLLESTVDHRPIAHAKASGGSLAAAEKLMLGRADAMFQELDLVFPHLIEVGDGMEIALVVELERTEAVERLDVVVTVE
jgi:hypothetical protein